MILEIIKIISITTLIIGTFSMHVKQDLSYFVYTCLLSNAFMSFMLAIIIFDYYFVIINVLFVIADGIGLYKKMTKENISE